VGDGRFLVAASPGRDGERTEKAKESNGLMKISRSGDQWVPEFAWKTDTATPSWASPVAYRGYAYWINRTGVVYCFEIESGKSVYTERIPQSVWATPVGIGDRLYCFGKDGLTTVLATGPEFKVLAGNELWSAEKPPVNRTPAPDESSPERSRASGMFGKPTLYGTAIVNGSLVLRTGSQLFCIRTGKSAE
jgi:outer membrane protein assembly factor BamB